MNIRQALAWSKEVLKKNEVSEPEASAFVLLADVLGMTKTEIMAHSEDELTSDRINKFKRYVARRKKHESVWHIIGRVEFMGLPLRVTKDVLVPRPETELLVHGVLKEIPNLKSQIQNTTFNILDVGTGSGTIAISVAHALKTSGLTPRTFSLVATDVSARALAVAKKNAKELKVEEFIKFVKTDLFPKTPNLSPRTFDLVVANLPYIPSEDLASLAVDVHHYEPKLALDGGRGGLEIYERFLSRIGDYIKPGGTIFCEIGINQGESFKKLAKKYLPDASVKILGDLAGIDRIGIIYLTNK